MGIFVIVPQSPLKEGEGRGTKAKTNRVCRSDNKPHNKGTEAKKAEGMGENKGKGVPFADVMRLVALCKCGR